MSTASQIPAGAIYGTVQYAAYKSKTKLLNVQVLLSSCRKEGGRVKWVMQWVGKVRQCKGHMDLKELCSSVRATPSNIPKKFRVR